MTVKDNEGNKSRGNRYNKSDDLLSDLQNVCVKSGGGCIWVFSKMSDVDSWYGRVVDVRSWMFNDGSWHRLSRGDTARCLMRVAVG